MERSLPIPMIVDLDATQIRHLKLNCITIANP